MCVCVSVLLRLRADEADALQTKDPLADATVVIKDLQKLALNEVRTHILAFDVYLVRVACMPRRPHAIYS